MIISPLQDENTTGNGTRVVTAAPGPLTAGLPLMYDADGNMESVVARRRSKC